MRPKRTLFLLTVLTLVAAGRSPAGNAREAAALADQHLSNVALIKRWADALYHFLPPEGNQHCDPSVTPWVDNGDGTFSQDVVAPDCTEIHIVSHGGSPSDYDEFITHPDGTKETLRARTKVPFFNGGPQVVHFTHDISTGEHIVYDEKLQLEPALDDTGAPIPGLNFWYALETSGTVQLATGDCQQFQLLQTKAFDCTNIFTGQMIPEAICRQWFDFNATLGVFVPKPDRLRVRLACPGKRGPAANTGQFTLTVPVSDPSFSIADFTRDAPGSFTLNNRTIQMRLISNHAADPAQARWSGWRTSGPGYQGTFDLRKDFSGAGQAFTAGSHAQRAPGSVGNPRRVEFIARWDRSSVGTVVVAQQATQPGSPFAGALEFGELKWSGLAAAFGPAPGL